MNRQSSAQATVDDPQVFPDLVPHPAGDPLVVKVRCWTSRKSGAPWTRHEVVVHPDWSVSTPHDLDAERLAAGFGGYLSCLELTERTIPAARRWVELQLRTGAAPVRLTGRPARWTVKPALACCPKTAFSTATKAAEHVRDVRHLATEFGGPRRQLTDVINAIGSAYRESGAFMLDGPDATAAGQACSRGANDVIELWYAGMHPKRVVEIHEALGGVGRLPGRFYLGVLLRDVDLGWLVDTLHASGVDPAELDPVVEVGGVRVDRSVQEPVAEWLAWTRSASDVIDPTLRGRWLALGVSRRMILLLDQHFVGPDDIAELARGVGRDPDGAARQLAGWLEAGLRPPVPDLLRLHASGLGPHWYVPSRNAVTRLRQELGNAAQRTTDTELAFLLAVAGTVPDAVARWRSGTTLW